LQQLPLLLLVPSTATSAGGSSAPPRDNTLRDERLDAVMEEPEPEHEPSALSLSSS